MFHKFLFKFMTESLFGFMIENWWSKQSILLIKEFMVNKAINMERALKFFLSKRKNNVKDNNLLFV